MDVTNATGCGCATTATPAGPGAPPSIPADRILKALKVAAARLDRGFGKKGPLLREANVHPSPNGFLVSDCAADDRRLILSVSGVDKAIPWNMALTWDLAFLFGKTGRGDDEIFQVEVDVESPFRQQLTIPLRGVGVLRDRETGRLLAVQGFELATDMVSADDASDISRVVALVACLMGCVGLVCMAACTPVCAGALPACLACLLACVKMLTAAGAILACFATCWAGYEGLTP